MGFPGGSVVMNPPANAGDAGFIPGSGRSPGGGNSNPLQYSEEPGGYGPWSNKRVGHDLQVNNKNTSECITCYIPNGQIIVRTYIFIRIKRTFVR